MFCWIESCGLIKPNHMTTNTFDVRINPAGLRRLDSIELNSVQQQKRTIFMGVVLSISQKQHRKLDLTLEFSDAKSYINICCQNFRSWIEIMKSWPSVMSRSISEWVILAAAASSFRIINESGQPETSIRLCKKRASDYHTKKHLTLQKSSQWYFPHRFTLCKENVRFFFSSFPIQNCAVSFLLLHKFLEHNFSCSQSKYIVSVIYITSMPIRLQFIMSELNKN